MISLFPDVFLPPPRPAGATKVQKYITCIILHTIYELTIAARTSQEACHMQAGSLYYSQYMKQQQWRGNRGALYRPPHTHVITKRGGETVGYVPATIKLRLSAKLPVCAFSRGKLISTVEPQLFSKCCKCLASGLFTKASFIDPPHSVRWRMHSTIIP